MYEIIISPNCFSLSLDYLLYTQAVWTASICMRRPGMLGSRERAARLRCHSDRLERYALNAYAGPVPVMTVEKETSSICHRLVGTGCLPYKLALTYSADTARPLQTAHR